MEKQRHIVAIPFPLQGHISPMLHFVHLLFSKTRNLIVTVLTFESHARVLNDSGQQKKFSKLRFMGIPDNPHQKSQGEWTDSNGNWLGSLEAVYTSYFANFGTAEDVEKLVTDLMNTNEPPTCLLSNSVSIWAQTVAEKVGLPWVALWTSSASCYSVNRAIPKLLTSGYLPPKTGGVPAGNTAGVDWNVDEADLPVQSRYDPEYKNMTTVIATQKKASALLFNTCEVLEQQIQKSCEFEGTVLQVGPLLQSAGETGLWDHDAGCLSWLDSRAPSSVVYISFGSLSDFDFSELMELAGGVQKSGHAFMWVLRKRLVRNDRPHFWEEFSAQTREQGMIVTWAPQEQVLQHKSVALFVTHCGWNSIQEAVHAGVPMLALPRFGDQGLNAGVLCHGLKIGRRLPSPLLWNRELGACSMEVKLKLSVELRM